MLVTKKQKKVLRISLIVSMIVAILIAMSVGIYFIVKSGKSQLLSKDQQMFGQAFSSLSNDPQEEVVDTSRLPSDMNPADLVFVTEEYFVSCNNSNEYKIYSLGKSKYVNVMFDFEKIESICGNIAVVSGRSGRSLIDLSEGTYLGSINNAKIQFSGGFALIESVDRGKVEFLKDTKTSETTALVVDTYTLDCLYSVSRLDDVIRLELTKNYIFAYFGDRTEVVSLKDTSIVKVFQNTTTTAPAGEGFASEYNTKSYDFSDFTRLSDLGSGAILLERAIADVNDFDLSLGAQNKYRLEYKVLNLESGAIYDIDNEGCVLSREESGANGYIAIVFSKIEDKTTISESQKTIKYYQFDTSKAGGLKEIVKYDYVKNGKVAGFNGKNLIVSGGALSGELDFSGNNTEMFKTDNNQKISFSNDVYVITSIIGEKTIYKKDGTRLFDKTFLMVSPFFNGNALAYDGESYYILNLNAEEGESMRKIKLSSQSVDYAFMGTGLYFVDGKNGVDVVRLGGERIYADASVDFTLLSQNSLLLKVTEGETSHVHKITTQRAFVKIGDSVATSLSEQSPEKVREFSAPVKGVLESNHTLEQTKEMVVDEVSGVGKMTYGFDYDMNDLTFRQYEDLTGDEKLMIPTFDQETSSAHNYVDSVNEKTYMFIGAHFLTNTNIAVAILKLNCDGKFFYVICVTMREMYISKITATSTISGVVSRMKGSDGPAPFDYSNAVIMPPNRGLVLFSELDNSKIRYPSFTSLGYDGGIVLSSAEAQSLQFEIEVRNTYYASGLSSDYIDYTDSGTSRPTQTFNYTGYTLTVDYANKTALIKATNGLFITGFSLAYATRTEAVYAEYEDKSETEFEVVLSEVSIDLDANETIFRLKNVSLTELYHKISLVNEEDEVLGEVYYFNGYTAARNPAPLGFKDFYRRTNIDIPEKPGYTFAGYTYGEDEAIDASGAYVYRGTFVKETTGVDVFKFVAKFEPNKYRIYFDVLNETLATDGLEVTFQSPIGEGLLTYDDIVALTEESPVLYNLVLGNEFDGWYTLPNGEGELYTSETIYNVVGNTTLYAKMIPRTYEITLHSNVESYANQIVDGFTYNIGEATLKEDYMSHSAGSVFTTTTIEVTFGSTYGVLPVLEGHSTDESKTGERYKFVGWFDQQTFMYLDGGEFSRGEQIDENTEVSNSPIKDLYAHYVREIYQVDLSVNNDAIAHAGDQDIEVLSELQYTGSTSDGKAITKDINLEGDNAWINQDGIYNAYTLQNEDINFAVKVNWGYYIRAIRVSVYPLGDTPASYTLTYTWDSATDSSSADSVLDNEYVQVTNGEETGIILKKVNSQTERGLYATIDIDVGVMHHNSVFNFVSDVDFHFSSVDELEVESDGRLFTFSNIGYGSTHEFKIDFLDREDIANAFIKSISVDGKIITFEQLYMLDDEGIYHLVLVGSEEAEESTEGDILERKYSLARDEFDSVEFICHTSISTGVTTYSVVICQTKSFRVDIEVEAINANVSVDPHAGRETAENGLDITASMNDEPVSDFNIEMSATDVVIYRIRAKEGMFISALNMKIGEENYSLFRTTLAEQDGNIVTQSTNVAVDTWFIVRSGVVYLNGTGVYISFSAASQTYTIYITNLAMDISFDVYYFSMTAISVKGGEGDVDYDFVVTRGLDSLIGTDLKETATEVDSGTVFASNNVYKVGNIYCFVGYKDSVKEIKLTLKFVGELAYKVTRTESSPVGYCSAEANNREVTINMMTNTAVITVERFSGRLTNFSSYLGVGGEEYEKDPFANRPLLSNINIIYQNSELAETTYILTRNFSAIGFVNNKLKVKVYKIKGYNYTTSKLIAGSEEIEPTLSEGEDDGGSYTLLEFVISDFSVTNFEIEVYQKAVEFDISYDPSNDSTHSATGSMANTHHVYNVESRLSEGGYEREFYTLIGYSLSPVSGADLTSEDCDFVVNENLTIDKYALFDLGDENGDIVVKLYLVFEANKYNVRPILNDSTMGSGSTVSSVPAEIEEVATDHALTGLGDLRRDGYTFLGWFTANTSSARKIEDGQVVDASFLRSVNIQNGAIEIHARWQANTYTIVVHKNDASDGGYGSTTATGTAGEHSVVFDQPFSKFASLSRVGYDYLGYKAVRLSSAQSLTDNHSYIGDGENCKLVLDGSYASLGITLNDETKVVDIYAVYTAQTFRAYVNLNNRSLATYNQPDGMTTVLYNGRSVKTNVDYVDMYLEVLFDSAFGTLPRVEPEGYNFSGFFVGHGNALSSPSTGRISEGTTLSLDIFNQLSYTSNTNSTEPLSTLYSRGTRTFSIYAHYSNMSYTVTYQVDDSNPSGYNIVASDKDAYNYASVTSGGYSNSASVPYASDIVLDFLTNKGTYIKTITIGYLESSEYKTVVVSFVWDNSGKVSYSVRGGTSVNNRETTNTYVQILNSTQYVANGIYLKVLDYNRDGTNKSNAVVDASRVIVAFDGIKTNMSVSIEVDDQTFEVKYYRYIKGKTGTPDSSDYLNTMQYKYGTVVDDAFLNSYTYTPSYSFSGYYYGSLSGGNITDPSNSPSSKLTKGTKITKNIILVGLYVYAERQAVSFYYFDTTTENYVTLEEVNRKYIVRYQSGGRDVKGEYADVNFDSDARLKTWPSPSQMQWPVGTYLVGYVIADSAPSGDYYSFTKGNTSGLSVLDGSVKVDRDLKAYAVYNTTKFNLRMRKSGGALQAMADYQLYDTAPDGSVRELDPSEIYLVKLTSSQKSIFDSVLRNTSQDVASALGAALNWDLSGIIPFSSRDYEDIGEVSGTAYFFLVTVAYSSDGRAYITQVSSNGYSYLSGRLSYFAT